MKKILAILCVVFLALGAKAEGVGMVAQEPARVVETERAGVEQARMVLQDESIRIEATNLVFAEQSYGAMSFGYVTGGSTEWAVEGYLFSSGSYFKTYSSAANNIQINVVDVSKESFRLVVSTATFSQTATGSLFTASGTDSLGRAFDIHLTYTQATGIDTVRYTFTEQAYIDDYGPDYFLVAESDTYLLYLDYYSDTEAGVYSTKNNDFNAKYTILYKIFGTDTIPMRYKEIDAVITEDETGFDIQVDYNANSGVYYIFTARSEKAHAEDTVQIRLTNVAHQELSPSYAQYYGYTHSIEAAPADSAYRIVFALVPSDLEGSFTEEDLNMDETYMKIGWDNFMIADAEFTCRRNNDGTYTLEGWFLAKNNTLYEFVFVTANDTQNIATPAEEAAIIKRIEQGVLNIEKNGVQYNAQGAIRFSRSRSCF